MTSPIPHVERFQIAYSIHKRDETISYKPEENAQLREWLTAEFNYEPNQWPAIRSFAAALADEHHDPSSIVKRIFQLTHGQWSCFSSAKWRDWCRNNLPIADVTRFCDKVYTAYNAERIKYLDKKQQEHAAHIASLQRHNEYLANAAKREKERVDALLKSSIQARDLGNLLTDVQTPANAPVIVQFTFVQYDSYDEPYDTEATAVIQSVKIENGQIMLIASRDLLTKE